MACNGAGRGAPRERGAEVEVRRSRRRRAAALASALALAGASARAECPPAGSDSFESSMTVILDVLSTGAQSVELAGPVTVVRSEPRTDGGVQVIDTELVAMELTGQLGGDPLHVRADPERSSVGEVRSQGAASCFPADSFFDVFVEVELPESGLVLTNLEPVRIEAQDLQKLPPLFDTYEHPPPEIPLVAKSDPSGPALATIAGGSSHRPEQDPTFGLAAGGSLDPATGYVLPKPPAIALARAGLGLQSGDDLDALSYGSDAIDTPGFTTLAFSVDSLSAGAPGTGVAQEAATGEQEGGEYVSFVNSTNQTLVPADALVPVAASDDLDALVDESGGRIDPDDDMVPDLPVFLSLAPGSPTLTANGWSPADVLVSQGGGVARFAEASALGLQAGDDVDAFCLMKAGLPDTTLRPGTSGTGDNPAPPSPPPPGPQAFDTMLFSLAPDSPTLADQGHAPGDVFVTDFGPSRPGLAGLPLSVYAEASELGLLAADDLDALKCLKPAVFVELDFLGDLDGAGNGTGCEDQGEGEAIDGGVVFGRGIENHSGDASVPPSPEPGQLGFFDFWSIQNPAAGDFHGPYAFPGTPAAAFAPAGDPALIDFVGGPGDNCGLPHVHGGFFGLDGWDLFGFHDDPDVLACGHGVFLPSAFPIQVIPTRRRDVPVVARQIALFLNAFFAQHGLPPVTVGWHLYEGPSTIETPTDCESLQATLDYRRAVLVFTGAAVTAFNLVLLPPFSGPDLTGSALSASGPLTSTGLPIRAGPPLRTLPTPLVVPEPGADLGAAAAGGVLALLAARCRPRRGRGVPR